MKNIILAICLLVAFNSTAGWLEELSLREMPNTPTTQSNLGKLWVDSITKGLFYLDSDGNEFNILLGGGGGGAANLNALSDVDTFTASPTVGQVLGYNGSLWVPQDSSGKALVGSSPIVVTQDATTATFSLNINPIEEVVTDSTLTGSGTLASPLSVVGGGGKDLVGTSPIVITQDSTTATFSLNVIPLETVVTDATLTGSGTIASPLSVVSSSGGKTLVGTSNVTITQDASTATFSLASDVAISQTLKTSTGFVTSLNKADGSFEKDTASWSASVGTITRTSSTELEGNYVGRWAGTGTGTLDFQWTATASNTYEAKAWAKVDVAADYQVCAVVNSIETGCKSLSSVNWSQLSVIFDSVKNAGAYLRLKHTGSGAFTADVDNAKVIPWEPQSAIITEQQSTEVYYNATSTVENANPYFFTYFPTFDKESGSGIYTRSVVNSHHRFTFQKAAKVSGTFECSIALSYGSYLFKNGNRLFIGNTSKGTGALSGVSFDIDVAAGDYLEFGGAYGSNSTGTETSLSMVATSTSQNVVTSTQDGFLSASKYGTKTNQSTNSSGYLIWASDFVTTEKGDSSLITNDYANGKMIINRAGIVSASMTLNDGNNCSNMSPEIYDASNNLIAKQPKNQPSSNYESSSVSAYVPAGGYVKYYACQASQVIDYSFLNVSLMAYPSAATLLALPTRSEVFSANVAAAGTITNATQSFVTSCTNAAPSICSLWSGFGNVPICWAHPIDITKRAEVSSSTATQTTVARTDTSTAFNLFCHLK